MVWLFLYIALYVRLQQKYNGKKAYAIIIIIILLYFEDNTKALNDLLIGEVSLIKHSIMVVCFVDNLFLP